MNIRYRQIGKVIAIAGVSSLLSLAVVNACTGLKLTADDGSVVNGRTLEFGIEVKTSVVVVPRGYEFTGTTPEGPGLSYKAKYGAVGCIAYEDMSIMDGMNEKGLAIGVFYFPGFAGYSRITADNKAKALSPIEFSNWVLTQFATLEEVKAGLSSVVVAPTVYKDWGMKFLHFTMLYMIRMGRV